jgi:hypothetical protein
MAKIEDNEVPRFFLCVLGCFFGLGLEPFAG